MKCLNIRNLISGTVCSFLLIDACITYTSCLVFYFATVTGHPQETHSGTRKQSLSDRQPLSSGESPLPQDANEVPKQKQQQSPHSTGM